MNYEKSGKFEQTAEFQQMYAQILQQCDEYGTLVMQDRFLERDADIAPFRFFRKGTREYIFPRQFGGVSLQEDTSQIVDPNHNYALHTEVQRYAVDESKVKGKIRIEYQDAGNNPQLKVTEVQGNSELPENVRKTLEELFAQ